MKKLSVIEKSCLALVGIIVLVVGISFIPKRDKGPKKLPPELQEKYEARMREKERARADAQRQEAAARREEAKQREVAQQQSEANRSAAQEKFKQWALDNLAITDIAINSSTLFVTLTPDKYTSKANVEEIARTIARYYCLQTKERGAVCRVYIGKELYAKGSYMP